MGDPRRVHLFAESIAEFIPQSASMTDVAEASSKPRSENEAFRT